MDSFYKHELQRMEAAFITRFQELQRHLNTVKDVDLSALPEIESWRILHFAKMAKMFDSLFLMITHTKDLASACSIIRSLYDNWYSYLFIYEFNVGEEKLLRFYLYVYDSFKQREDSIALIKKDQKLKPAEIKAFDQTVAVCEEKKNHYFELMQKLSLYAENKVFIDKVKDYKEGWTYKNFSEKPGTLFKWSGLYDKLSGEDRKGYLNFLSQYVHGLYASNSSVVPSSQELYYTLSEALSILCSVNDYLDKHPLNSGPERNQEK